MGRGLGDGLDLGVGVGRGVAVAVAVDVAVAVAVGVGVAVRRRVGVASDMKGATTSTVTGEPVLKKPMFASLRRGCGRIEPEIIKCPPANRVGVLVLRKSFVIPSHRARILSKLHGVLLYPCISCVPSLAQPGCCGGAWNPTLLKVTPESWRNDLEGLNGAIQVHVKDGVLIMPQPGIWASYLVTDEEDPIVTRIGLNLIDCGARSCPGLDSRLHSDGGTDW